MKKYLQHGLAAIILPLLLILLISSQGLAREKNTGPVTDSYVQGLYEIKYKGVLNYYSNVLLVKDSLFLPLFDFFSKLKIYYEYDNNNKVFQGFFIEQENLYKIDFNTKTINYQNKEFFFTDNDYIFYEGEIYVRPAFITSTFGIDFNIHPLDLSVTVKSQDDLPVYLFTQKNKSRKNLLLTKGEYEDLLFDRKRSILDGFILTYNLGTVQNIDRYSSYSARLNAGLELLGGELITSYSSTYNPGTKAFNDNYFYNWNYVFGNNRILNQIGAGYVSSSTLSGVNPFNNNVIGLRLSNEPYEYNTYYTNRTIEGETGPGWLVELYINSRMVSRIRTKKDGKYLFKFPIQFGNNNIQLKFFGTKGEIEEKNKIIFIPSYMVKPGEFNYTLTGGESVIDREKNAIGVFSLGMTEWMTISGGANRNFDRNAYDFYSYLSLNLFSSTNINLFASPDNYNFTLIQPLTGQSTIRGSFTYYNKSSVYAIRGILNNASLDLNLPRIAGIPFNYHFHFTRSDFSTFGLNNYYFMANGNFSPFALRFKYTTDFIDNEYFSDVVEFRHTLNTQLTYRLSAKNFLWSVFDRIQFSVSSIYDISNDQFRNIRGTMNKNVLGLFRLGFSMNKNLITNNLTYFTTLSLNLNLDGIRSSTRGYYYNNGNRSFSQNFAGTILYDSYDPGFLMNRYTYRTSINTGTAAFRFFLDENLDGMYDEGEMIIPDVKVTTDRGSIDRSSNHDLSYVYNIPPHIRVNTYVNKTSFANPLWLPVKPAFSFIADPNNVKGMDVPCYAAGIIEGKITKVVGAKSFPVSGVRLHLLSKDSSFNETIPVFSDGSFYYMGVPPGDYMIWVDSTQMELLGVNAREAVKEFTIEITTHGDYVGNINFELIPKYITAIEDNLAKSSDNNQLGDISGDGLAKSSPDINLPKSKKSVKSSKDITQAKEIESKAFLYNGAKDIALTSDMKKYLDRAADYLKAHPTARIVINGFADSFGAESDVIDISDKRAQKALEYILQKGIVIDRVISGGKGIYDKNASSPDKKKNSRRLEIRVIE